jgi:nicotinamidase-related amidase
VSDAAGSNSRPWLDAIPREDVESFAGGYDSIDRPIEHGESLALVIVDMTLSFVDSAYPTGWSPTGWPAVDSAKRLLEAARAHDVPVYFSKAFPEAGHVPIRGQQGLWKPSQHRTSSADQPPGDVIVDELAPLPGEIVINKPSAFFGTTLASDLVADRVDTVVLAGMTTSGCVRASAIDAFQNNFQVLVVEEACADRSQISHAVALFDLHMKYADVIPETVALELLGNQG